MRKIHVFILASMVFWSVSCDKKTVIKEQTVFENLLDCLCDTINTEDCKIAQSDHFDLIDAEGFLYSTANYSNLIQLRESDALKVDRSRFPTWEKRFYMIVPCNLPKELSKRDFEMQKVRLSCRLYYEPLPWPGRSLISQNGYSAKLLRIELIQ